jgi:hypothetical protein
MNRNRGELKFECCAALEAAERFRVGHNTRSTGTGGNYGFALDLNRPG